MKFKHINGVIAKATFSDCENFRYLLEIVNNDYPVGKTICVVMQNPSVANSEDADRSVQFLEKLIFQKEYPEFEGTRKILIVNQFAYVQTNDFKGTSEHIGKDNDRYIKAAISESDTVLIAWGASNAYSQRKSEINQILTQFKGKVLLQTKSHPSRGTYVNFVEPYKA